MKKIAWPIKALPALGEWKAALKYNYREALFVCLAFFLMVIIGCLSVSLVIRQQSLAMVDVALSETEKTIKSYLREPRLAFTNIYITVRDMLDRGESQQAILEYLTQLNQSMARTDDGVVGFFGVYAYLRDEFIDSIDLKPGPEFNPQDRPWYQKAARSRRADYTAPYQDAKTGFTVMSLTREVYGRENDYYGVLSMDLDLSWLIDYAKSLHLSEGGYGLIVNQYLGVFAHPDERYKGRPLAELGPGYAQVARDMQIRRKVTARRIEEADGQSVIVFFRELYNGWHVGVVMPTAGYYSNLYRTAAILAAVGLALAGALTLLLLRLSVAKMRSDRESHSKSTFLATMSHEIRTPLNAIIGLSEIQLHRNLADETRSDLEKIHSSGSNLLTIINDILDLSKVEAGRFEVLPENYDLLSLINDTVQINMVRVGSRPIAFELKLDETIPSVLKGDEVRLRQILSNLLSNAFKYTQKGRVTLSVDWKIKDQTAWLIFTVTDTGIGIKKEELGRIFNIYRQADSALGRKVIEGTGLGLAIVKGLVELMGGKITVVSDYGRGSTFRVTLPQKVIDPVPIGRPAAESLMRFRFLDERRRQSLKLTPVSMKGARVLVVDDIAVNLDVARGLLAPYGLTVDCVQSGQEAVDLISRGEPRYDAVLLDHMMPEMDGLEAAGLIRRDIGTEYARTIPIIAMTANALVGNEEMFLSAGFNAFVSKPVDRVRLDGVLKRFIKFTPLKAPPEPPAEPQGTGLFQTCAVTGLDVRAMLLRYGSEDTYLALLRSYARHTPAILADIIKARDEGLVDRYAVLVHGLKGSSWSIGANEVAALAQRLETDAKRGGSPSIHSDSEALISLTRTLLAALEDFLATALSPQQTERPTAEFIDPALLAALLEADRQYDMTAMEEIMDKIEAAAYLAPGEAAFSAWLREQVESLEYEALEEKLSTILAERNTPPA